MQRSPGPLPSRRVASGQPGLTSPQQQSPPKYHEHPAYLPPGRVPPRRTVPAAIQSPSQYYQPAFVPPMHHMSPYVMHPPPDTNGYSYNYGGQLPPPAPLPPPPSLAPGVAPLHMPGGLIAPPEKATHYGKVSIVMLILGAAVGYAVSSATTGAQCSNAYATNETRTQLLASVLRTVNIDQPQALAAQIDAWVVYERSVPPGSELVVGASHPPERKPSSWFFTPTADMSPCADGLLISGPIPSPANITLYLLLLLWSFAGVAIGADVFMVAIEMITSQETTVTKLVDGRYKQVTVLVWNGTVANLTLMALGSSAPEILLSVIEISTSGFYGAPACSCRFTSRRPIHSHSRPRAPPSVQP